MNRCLILMDGNRPETDLELLEVTRRIHGESQIYTMGLELEPKDEKPSGAFDAIVNFECGSVPPYDAAGIAMGAAALHEMYGFDTILVPATFFGRMVAPRLAMRLGVGLVADVTGIEHVGMQLEMIRPAYGGKLMAGIVKKGPGPLMMSIRENAFPATSGTIKQTRRIVFPFDHQPSRMTFIGAREKPQATDIRDSEILISGGGGILENFSRLDDLKEVLHAQVSASRRLVDSGVASRKIQVGQSGKTVSPRLYIALGIDGSVQHMEGLRHVEHLIAVNTNREAPICSLADVVVVGDAVEFIDRLVKRIQLQELSGG